MKNILKIIGFTAGVLFILWVLSWFFDGTKWLEKGYIADRDVRITGIDAEIPGQIDVLNVGDSLCNASMTPMELYRDYGYTAYNIGRDLQKPLESLFCIRKATKKQQVKVILWEAHNLVRDDGAIDFANMLISEYFKYKVPFIKYHYIWKNWLEGPGIRKYFKGYMVNEEFKPYRGGPNYWYLDKEVHQIQKRQKLLFKLALDYCRKNNIQLVMYSGISAYSYDMRIHNAIVQIAEEYDVEYLDANYDKGKISIDWSHDSFDGGDHMNLFGCQKMTRYLGNYLADECGLTDHRGDPAYRNWDDLLPAYEQELKDMEGTSYPTIEKTMGKNK